MCSRIDCTNLGDYCPSCQMRPQEPQRETYDQRLARVKKQVADGSYLSTVDFDLLATCILDSEEWKTYGQHNHAKPRMFHV